MDDFHKILGIEEYDFRLIIGTTGIEYDENKDKKNKEKHGFSLKEAADVFTDVLLFQTILISNDPIFRGGEIRQNHMAQYNDTVVHISTTMRPGEKVRIISMRKASRKERKIYQERLTF